MKNPSLQPYYAILISGFLFSWMATFAPLAMKGCGWQLVAVIRCAIPLVVVSVWAKWGGAKLVFWGPPVLWLRSLAGSCSLVGTFCAFHLLPLTDIYTIANIFPIWVALLSWPMFGRFPSFAVWLAIFSSILGVALIQGPQLRAGNYGALIVVAVSLFTAIAMMGLNRLKNIDPRAIVVHFSATALLFAILSFFLFPLEPAPEAFQTRHLFELAGMGLAATFGQYFLTKAFTGGDPAKVAVASLSQFVMILLLDIFVLQNPLDPSKLWGVPLILGPTAWLMLQRGKPAPPPPPPTEEPLPLLPCEAQLALCVDPAASTESK